MDVREKLIEILRKPIFPHELVDPTEAVADYLLDSGVTVQEWVSVKDRLPENEVDYRTINTNADKIRAMSDEELSEFIRSMVDESNSHNVACYGCINYGTHHSDPANKGTPLYECDGCENEGIGLDVLMWLQQPVKEEQ